MVNPWLRKFLNVYWLRPENALWRAINCVAMEDLEFAEPSLDMSCGDGIFSFIRADGDFDASFDIFGAVANLDRFFQNVDIYDATDADYHPAVIQRPRYQITVGTDWKQNLLSKAAPLGLYRELQVHDNNDPLPFEDDAFRTVFSNSVYWMENIPQLLEEIARVLHPEGIAIMVLKTNSVKDYTLERLRPWLGSEWLDMIDRGRRDNYPRLYDDFEWTEMIQGAGLEIHSRLPQVTWVHAHLWDVGLRPLSPVLIEMANALDPVKRREVKQKWIATWEKLLRPFCSPDCTLGVQRAPAEIIYVARKPR